MLCSLTSASHLSDKNLREKSSEEDGLVFFVVSVVSVCGHLEPRARGCYGTKAER